MHPAFHQEIARSRQAEMLKEARLAHLAREARIANPRPGLIERLASRIPHRRRLRAHRPVLGLGR
jgi:hypothetical protein